MATYNYVDIISIGFFSCLLFASAFELWMIIRSVSWRTARQMFREWQHEVRMRRIYRKIGTNFPVPPETLLERWLVP